MNDELDWFFFLQMSSVDHTVQFVEELNLPFEPVSYTHVKSFARICLETYFFNCLSNSECHKDSPGLVEAWSSYRKNESETSEEFLSRYRNYHVEYSRVLTAVYDDLEGSISLIAADSLRKWFNENFPLHWYQIWQWPWLLRELVIKSLPSANSSLPLNASEKQSIIDFYHDYQIGTDEIENRIDDLMLLGKSSQPSLWEAVLQAFPADGPIKNCPWIADLGQCLKYQLVKRLWNELSTRLEPDSMNQLIDWVRQQSRLLSVGIELQYPPDKIRIDSRLA